MRVPPRPVVAMSGTDGGRKANKKLFNKLQKARSSLESRRAKQLIHIARTLDNMVQDELEAIEQFKKAATADAKKTGNIDIEFDAQWTSNDVSSSSDDEL